MNIFIGNQEQSTVEFARGRDKKKRRSRRKGSVVDLKAKKVYKNMGEFRKEKVAKGLSLAAGVAGTGALAYAGLKNRKAIAGKVGSTITSGRGKLANSVDNFANKRTDKLLNKKGAPATPKKWDKNRKQNAGIRKLASRIRGN